MIDLREIELVDEDFDRQFMDEWIHDFGACALSAADQLGLFDAFEGDTLSPTQLSQQLKLDEIALRATCRALVAMGAMRCRGDSFALSDFGEKLWVSTSPAYRGREFDRHRGWEQHERIVETLRKGWAPLLDTTEAFSEGWRRGDVSADSAETFTRVMHSLILSPSVAAVRSGAFARLRHLVDVGGGSGALAAAVLAHHPESRATVMDLAPVCAASRAILQDVRSGARVQYCPANFFEDPWPEDADGFSFSNILHDWPLPTCRQLLQFAFDALPPGGSVFVHEALLDSDACSPRMAVLFNLLMLMNHRGQQFTQLDLFELLGEAGFSEPRIVIQYSHWSLLRADKPRP
ncbi:MAG: hypothetical protein HRU17_16455 [Polyangiaceae bacterium]|nr:hypothetical protein [Polyangiaceae bacterium]